LAAIPGDNQSESRYITTKSAIILTITTIIFTAIIRSLPGDNKSEYHYITTKSAIILTIIVTITITITVIFTITILLFLSIIPHPTVNRSTTIFFDVIAFLSIINVSPEYAGFFWHCW
jgi:hypothetical protein